VITILIVLLPQNGCRKIICLLSAIIHEQIRNLHCTVKKHLYDGDASPVQTEMYIRMKINFTMPMNNILHSSANKTCAHLYACV